MQTKKEREKINQLCFFSLFFLRPQNEESNEYSPQTRMREKTTAFFFFFFLFSLEILILTRRMEEKREFFYFLNNFNNYVRLLHLRYIFFKQFFF